MRRKYKVFQESQYKLYFLLDFLHGINASSSWKLFQEEEIQENTSMPFAIVYLYFHSIQFCLSSLVL